MCRYCFFIKKMPKRKYQKALDWIQLIYNVPTINEYLFLEEYYNTSITCMKSYQLLNDWTSDMIIDYIDSNDKPCFILKFLNRIQKITWIPILRFYDLNFINKFVNIALMNHSYLKSHHWDFSFTTRQDHLFNSKYFIEHNKIQLSKEVHTLSIQFDQSHKDYINYINSILKTGTIYKIYFYFEEYNKIYIESDQPIQEIFEVQLLDTVHFLICKPLISVEAEFWTTIDSKDVILKFFESFSSRKLDFKEHRAHKYIKSL